MVSSPQFEQAVRSVESLVLECQHQGLGGGEFTGAVVDVFLDYLRQEDPRDDVDLLVEYCVGWARELSTLRLFADRTMPADMERHLGWCLDRQVYRLEFDDLMRGLEHGLRTGDDDARSLLVDLCREGVRTHARLFAPVGWGLEVLVLAYEHQQSRALDAALRPTSSARLAGRRRDRGKAYPAALSFLGHLACDPVRLDAARIARDALCDLVDYDEIGADAAVRLPPHLLDRDQRNRLVEVVERREALEEHWAADGFHCRDSALETELIRTVAWQAADCGHAELRT